MAIATAATLCTFSDLPPASCSHCTAPQDRATEVTLLALAHMREHGLLAEGWRFGYDNGKNRLGQCNYSTRTITMSRHWVEVLPEEKILNTLLHEIAHALTPGHHHDNVWRAKAIALGSSGKRCSDTGGIKIDSPWVGTCPTCGNTTSGHRAPLRVKACSKCCGRRFNPAHIYTWKKHGKVAAMSARYRSELSLVQDSPSLFRF